MFPFSPASVSTFPRTRPSNVPSAPLACQSRHRAAAERGSRPPKSLQPGRPGGRLPMKLLAHLAAEVFPSCDRIGGGGGGRLRPPPGRGGGGPPPSPPP